MRILVITKYAWDDRISSGNTLTNLFSEWPNAVFYTVYCRSAYPNNECCHDYFTVSPINLLKNFFTPWKIGRSFSTENPNEDTTNGTDGTGRNTEASITKISKKIRILSVFYDLMYSTRLWMNKKLKRFLENANPEIVFCFGISDAFNLTLIKHIKRIQKVPVVSYFVDDHYKTGLRAWEIYNRNRNRRLKELALISDKRYAITQMMCDAYSEIMQVKFELLTKGCQVCDVVLKDHKPLRMVYAGNLLFNRDKTLIDLVKVLKDVNKENGRRLRLDIYSATPVNEYTKFLLNEEGVSILHPSKPYSEITTILKDADIVLHVESFDREQREVVRYSFSTKITDCLQSGAMVMAIGPDDIASIDFMKRVPGAIVVTDMQNLGSVLLSLLQNPQSILDNARFANAFARREMCIEGVRLRLQNDFDSLIKQ